MVNRIVSLAAIMLIFFSSQSELMAQNQFAAFSSINISNQLGKNTYAPSNKELTAILNCSASENFPICSQTNDQEGPAIAYNTMKNEFLVVWHDKRNGDWDIYGQRISSSGNKIQTDFPISISKSYQEYPALAYNQIDNEYLVVWMDYRSYNDVHHYPVYIFGQRIAGDGTVINGNFPISTFITNLAEKPSVAYGDSLNEYLVVWDADIDTNYVRAWDFKIHGKQVSNTGNLLDNLNTPEDESNPMINFQISADQGHQEIAPDIVYNKRNAEYFVVWRDGRYYPGSGNDDIFGQILTCTGKQVLEHDIPICIQHDRDGYKGQNQNSPAVAYNNLNNEYLVVWHDERNHPDRRIGKPLIVDIYGQLVSADGKLMDNPKTPENENDPTINYRISMADSEQFHPDVAYDYKSNCYKVVWSDLRNLSLSNEDIYGQCVSDSGELIDDSTTSVIESDPKVNYIITTANDLQNSVSIAYNTLDSIDLIAWSDWSNRTISGADIFGQIFTRCTSVYNFKIFTPDEFYIKQNYPNPFNSETVIEYNIHKSTKISLKVFDLLGREITTLIDEDRMPGCYNVHWNGKDKNGNNLASGIYYYQIAAGEFKQTKKLALIR